MAKVFIDEATLTAIGDAIREKEGSSELVPVVGMAERIKAISTTITTLDSYYTNGLEYELVQTEEEDYYAVVGRGTAPTSGTIRIPPTHKGLPVTKISKDGCYGVENIIVPNSVEIIEAEAFNNVGGKIYIPNSVVSITGKLQSIAYHLSGMVAAQQFYVEWTSKPSGWAEDWNVYTEPGEGDFTTYTRTGCITDLFALNDR